MTDALNQHPGLFIFGGMFLVYEFYVLMNAPFVAWLALFSRDFKAKTPQEKQDTARRGEVPTELLPLGIITIAYGVWCVWCCFVPGFQIAGAGILSLMLVSNYALGRTNNQNHMAVVMRADAVASLAVMGVCAYWM